MRHLDPQHRGRGRSALRSAGSVLVRSFFFGAGLLLLSGCGTIALRHSFDNYSDTYAETQNRQMLLNLARLSEREPIYFFQLAQISAGYTFTESLNVGDTKSIGLASSTTANVRTATGALGGSATHNPVFTLVPLGGDKFATELLAPIKPEIFYELFEEGWPVDLLMRVLIERIELVESDPADSAGGETPLPTGAQGATGERLEILINNPLDSNGGHYDRFLRACALAREFQKKGILYLDISEKFEPLADRTVFPYPPSAEQQQSADKEGLVWKQESDDPALLQPKDTPEERPRPESKAGGGGQPEHDAHERVAGNWQLGRNVKLTLFKLNKAGLAGAADELKPDSVFAGNDDLMGKFNLVLDNGIGVTDTNTSKGAYHVRLVMRSLLGAMLALANEQRTFQVFDDFRTEVLSQGLPAQIEAARKARDQLADPKDLADDAKRRKWEEADPALQRLIAQSVDTVPESENHPVLILNWPGNGAKGAAAPPETPAMVASVSFKNKQYAIADQPGLFRDNEGRTDPSLDTWNRDVFRLLVQLSLQVTADPSTFALPSLLQSH